ncbi:MAG: hypothetical protein HZB12_01650 [Candidatus Yonathbacteria bacterium]|nr:hypothetical protein [Candidatus Yonathbacteria bacterium]
MAQKEKDEAVQDARESTRMHLRDYLRTVEIGAVMVLSAVIVVGLAFRGSAPIIVTNNGNKMSETASTSTLPIPKMVETEHFVVTTIDKVEGSAKENIATADPKIFKAPTNFKSFLYDATLGKKIALTGTCKDAYYALLIFKTADDYRKDPARSYYNSAYPCPASSLIALEVDLQSINLPTGSYYLFLADQGNTGSWYNPR